MGEQPSGQAEPNEREEDDVQSGVFGHPTDEREEHETGAAPGEAHEEGGDGSRLGGDESLSDDDVDRDGEEEDEAAGGEESDGENGLADEEEEGQEGHGPEEGPDDDAFGSEAVRQVPAEETAEGSSGEIGGRAIGRSPYGEATLPAQVEHEVLCVNHLNC